MDRSESKFIEEIIGEIRRLIPKLLHVGENIVGMDENLKKVKFLIDTQSNEVSMVGIYGIGGIGKTTIAKVIYNDMLDQFKRHSFLENVREKSKDDRGVLQLQEKLLCDILMEKNLKLSNIDEGIKMIIKSKHHLEKVLIVLDDVDCPKQLKFFAPNSEWFHPGSIIIVTTRNKRCLDVHESYSSYEAKGLAHKQAKELFCWNAFQQHHPEENYVDLSNRILDYAKGLPLALVVLGSFLFQRDVDEWESTLHKLKTNPLEDIQKVLQISYDGLDDKCKKLFLDIACFFKDQEEKFVTRILEGCKLHPKIGLRVLEERCLISIFGGTIRMHDLLQEMGSAIVRQNYPEQPGKWSRLWEYEDIESVFTKNMGTNNIEGIFLNWTKAKPIQLATEAFRKMNQLRLLKVEYNMKRKISVGDSLFGGHGISIVIPRSSGILEWIGYQSTGSDEVIIELPPNWCENNDLLGFALCCVYVSLDDKFNYQYEDPSAHESQNESAHTSENEPNNGSGCESENEELLEFYCNLSIRENNQSADVEHFSFIPCCVIDGVSDIA
ncbi:disease resistance protein RUN1-like [Vitis riparia]|uniref:disease resistance protein RUN1-like n=1 Tax=Vitis riparia TaxID=96939 RepID=UPI00155AAB14|nr:disease resistance protein RUN1-like [Vitis riparia]